MGLISGLLSIGRQLLTGGARAAAPIARAARTPIGAAVATGAVGGAAFVGAEQLLGGVGAGGIAVGPTGIAPAGQAIAPAIGGELAQLAAATGGQVTPLSGGRTMLVAPNGDMQVFNRMGMAVRPSIIIPAGSPLPGGATVVSIRQGGALIGITRRRRRRAFATEVRRVRRTIQGCRAVLSAAEKPKRRS